MIFFPSNLLLKLLQSLLCTLTAELPFGWKKIVKTNGEIVFQHESDEMTTHSDPRLAFAHEYGENPTDVRYKFDASSTANEVLHGLDLSNRIAIVTGANTGIGMFHV